MPTTGKVKGRLLQLYLAGNAIANAKNVSFSINGNLVDATTITSAGWQEFEDAGDKSATISTDALLALDASYTVDDVLSLLIAGTTVTWRYTTNVSSDKYLTGNAKVSSVDVNSGNGQVASYSIALNVTGAVTVPTLT